MVVRLQANTDALFCSCSHIFLLCLIFNTDTDASSHRASPFSDRKMHPFFHRHPLVQLHRHLDVFPLQPHLPPFLAIDPSRYTRPPHIKLRLAPPAQRPRASPLFLTSTT